MENENLNLPPFYVGQKVVSLIDGIYLVKGREYTIKNLHKFPCGCWSVDVGVTRNKVKAYCICGQHRTGHADGDYWFTSTFFAPLEERFISFAEVIAIESPLIGAN